MTKILIGKSIVLLLALTAFLSASSDVCKTEWVLSNGVKASPPPSFRTFTITDSQDLNSITVKTSKNTNHYRFDGFIDLHDGKLGVSYKQKELSLDRFTDGTMFLWDGDIQILKAKCPKIEIGKAQG